MCFTKTLIMLDKIFTLGLLLTAPIFASCHCHCQNGGHFLSHVINYPLAYRGHTTVLAPSYGSHQGGCSIYSGAGIQGYYPKGHGPNYGRYYDTSYYPSDSSAEAAAEASTFTSNAGSSSATAASAASAARGSSGIISFSHGPKCGGYYGTSYYYPGSSAESASASASSASTSNSGSSSVAEATAASAARGSSGIISYGHGPKCGGYYDTSYNYPGSSTESAAASSASVSNSDSTSAAAASAAAAVGGGGSDDFSSSSVEAAAAASASASDSSSAAATSTATSTTTSTEAGEYHTTSYEYSSSSAEAIPAASTTAAISASAPSSVTAAAATTSTTGVGKVLRPPFYGVDPGWGWGWGGYYVNPLSTKIPKYYSIHPIYGGQKPYLRWECRC